MQINIIHKIKKTIFYYKYNFFRTIRILFKINQKILINGRKIILPPGHLLSIYNRLYPKYDRFISRLVKNVAKNQSVVDIGANVGDTLVRMMSHNNSLKYYSIEADDYFFKFLKKNVEKSPLYKLNKVTLIKKLVGMNLVGNLSKTTTGTKSLIENKIGMRSQKLDEIIKKNNIKNIGLIKVDVDGFDYNVLLSAMYNIKKYKPILFFEYMSLNETGYISLIKKLKKIGYKNWTVLNNYGEFILKKNSYIDVLKLIKTSTKNKIIIDICCYQGK